MKRRDLHAVDDIDQISRVAVTARFGHDYRRPCHQRPEELPDRDVETVGRFLQHEVALIESVFLLHPQDAVADATMLVHRALRLAGRARGVDDVSQRAVGHGNIGIHVVFRGDVFVSGFDDEHVFCGAG